MSIKQKLSELNAANVPAASGTRLEIYDWIECVIAALVFCVLLFVFGVRIVDVDGPSMNPTLSDKDKMVVSDLFYTPKQGDIIIFQKDSYKKDALVKRVIATEGQLVEIDFDRGIVKVDGETLDEPYILEPTWRQLDFSGVERVPEGCIFVMGDNRNNSSDSRVEAIGMIDTRMVIGKVHFVLFPFNHFGSPYGA